MSLLLYHIISYLIHFLSRITRDFKKSREKKAKKERRRKKMIWDEDEFCLKYGMRGEYISLSRLREYHRRPVDHRVDDHQVGVESLTLILLEIGKQFFLLRVGVAIRGVVYLKIITKVIHRQLV